jgi:hypothetical protein
MSLASIPIPDLAGIVLGFIFTIMIFSYLLGDNPLFRLATHIFIGVAAGFSVVVVIYNVGNQMMSQVMQNPVNSLYLVVPPLILGLWLLSKLSLRFAWIGNPVMAYLVGAAAATAIGGAILGTLFPQIGASASAIDVEFAPQGGLNTLVYLIKGVVLLIGTVATLVYFHYGARQAPGQPVQRRKIIDNASWVGMVFIAITLGVVFAGVYTASLSALIDRARFIFESIKAFIG